MTTPKTKQATASNRGESEAQMELNEAFGLADRRMNWMEDARCASPNKINWFPGAGRPWVQETVDAKQFCAKCDVRIQCLTFAMNNKINHGIWGGKLPRERRQMSRHQPLDKEPV